MYLRNNQINLNRGRRDTNRHDDYGNFNSIWICSLFSFLRWWRYTFWRTEKEKMVRVRSNRANHINLAQYLKKGKLLLVEGVLGEPEIWEDKQHVQHVQLSIVADSITFISTGKKKLRVKIHLHLLLMHPLPLTRISHSDRMGDSLPRNRDITL